MFEAENGFSESTSIYGDDEEVVFDSEEYPFEDQTHRFIEIFYHDDYDVDDDEADFM